jgi:fatty-acid desaturase
MSIASPPDLAQGKPITQVAAEVDLAPRVTTPVGVSPLQMNWVFAITLSLVHALALFALVPYLFSWSGVVLCVGGHYFFGLLGITLGYHRLITHKGFVCSKRLEHFLAILGVCCLQDTPVRWVAIHRRHHQFSDDTPDPHSPLVTFSWGHLGWLVWQNRETNTLDFYERYARDLLSDPFYLGLERHERRFWIYLAHAVLFFLAGMAVGWATTGAALDGLQLGLSWLVWGVFVRTVVVWHITWSVNSLTHIWGYRNYQTTDNSRNNWLVGLLAHGEGWHNNHHAQQRTAAHGHRWWEFDQTWHVIRLLEICGLATDVVRPRANPQTAASENAP